MTSGVPAAAWALLAEHLPGGLPEPPVRIGEGDHCVAFRAGSRVVRIAKHAEAAAALRREACVLPRIADRLPLPVPRPTLFEPPGGPPFSVHDEVRGDALSREAWLALPAAAREGTAAALAGFLRALHDLPTGAAAGCGLPRVDLRATALDLRERAPAARLPLPGAETRRRLVAVLARWSAPGPAEARGDVLLHRDVAPGHVLFDPGRPRLTGVIDFGDLALGDPARDFVYVHEDFGPEMLAAVLRHYGREDPASLLPRVHAWYLLEALAWTLDALEAGQGEDARHGLAEIARELDGPAARG